MSEPGSATEVRLASLLMLLRLDAPRPSDSFAESVMRAVRRQHLTRSVVSALEDFFAAAARALAVLFGLTPPRAATA